MCHEAWSNGQGRREPDEVGGITLSDGVEMPAWTYHGAEPGAVCIVLPDIYGPSPFYHYVTAQLAAAGYEATLVDYFMREGELADKSREGAFARRAKMNENTCLADISTAIDVIAGGQKRKVLLGLCLSGTFAEPARSLVSQR
jgi:carboxymethylenebutenolidase